MKMNTDLLENCRQTIRKCSAQLNACKTNEAVCEKNIEQAKSTDLDIIRHTVAMLLSCLGDNPEKMYKEALGKAIEECGKLIKEIKNFEHSFRKNSREEWANACDVCVTQCAAADDACKKAEERYNATVNHNESWRKHV